MSLLVCVDERYIPPIVDPDNPEIRNSDNTVLFLMSCYQYIMIAIILSVGPPYRQTMVQNGIPRLKPSSNDSSVHVDHRDCGTLHHDNDLDSTIIRGVNITIDVYECIVCIPFNCDCVGEFHGELGFREDYFRSGADCFR